MKLFLILLINFHGSMAFGHGLLDEQILEKRKQVELFSDRVVLKLELAELYRAHDEYEKAKTLLIALLQNEKPYQKASFNLARLEKEQGKLDDAGLTIIRFLEHFPDDPDGLREGALIHSQLKDWKKAANLWTRRFGVDEHTRIPADDYLQAGQCFLKAGRKEDSQKVIDIGLRVAPRYIPLMQFRAEIALASGKLKEAKRHFDDIGTAYQSLKPRLSLEEGKIWKRYQKDEEAVAIWKTGYLAIQNLPISKRRQKAMIELEHELHKLSSP